MFAAYGNFSRFFLFSLNRVGFVRMDASCVRQMGYLAIFFCVFSSVVLASFEVLPLRGRKYDAKGGFCVLLASSDFCVGIVLVNSVDLFLEKKGLLPTCLSTKIHCNHTPRAVVTLRRHPLPSRAAPSRRHRIYTWPSTFPPSPPIAASPHRPHPPRAIILNVRSMEVFIGTGASLEDRRGDLPPPGGI